MELTRMNLSMKLLLLHVGRDMQTHLFDSVHSYWCGQAHLGIPKVILNIKSGISRLNGTRC